MTGNIQNTRSPYWENIQLPSMSSMGQWGQPQSMGSMAGQAALTAGANFMNSGGFNMPTMPGSSFNVPGMQSEMIGGIDSALADYFKPGGTTGGAQGLTRWDYLLGGKAQDGSQTMGIASPLIGLGKGILDGYMGMQQLKLGKDALKFQKNAFSSQFDEQKRLNDVHRGDIERARASSRG